MGLDVFDAIRALPSRPNFFWEISMVTWTDSIGDKLPFVKALHSWCNVPDQLDYDVSNKIRPCILVLYRIYNLAGRAQDHVSDIQSEILSGGEVVQLISGGTYKRDILSLMSLVLDELKALNATRRASDESLPQWESPFASHLSLCNDIYSIVSISDCMNALSVLSNSDVADSQCIYIFAAASLEDSPLTAHSNIADFLMKLSYESIETVVEQCVKTIQPTPTATVPALSAIQTGASSGSSSFFPYSIPKAPSLAFDRSDQHNYHRVPSNAEHQLSPRPHDRGQNNRPSPSHLNAAQNLWNSCH